MKRPEKRKEQHSKRQELAFNIEFKLLKIVSDRKVRIQKRVPQTRSAEVNSVGVELLVMTIAILIVNNQSE